VSLQGAFVNSKPASSGSLISVNLSPEDCTTIALGWRNTVIALNRTLRLPLGLEAYSPGPIRSFSKTKALSSVRISICELWVFASSLLNGEVEMQLTIRNGKTPVHEEQELDLP